MKIRVLSSLMAVTFVFGAMSSADAGFFGCGKKKTTCCQVQKVACAPQCAPVTCAPVKCAPAPTCCSPQPSCCAPGSAAAHSAPATKGAPKATDAPPAPPAEKKKAPKPKAE